MSWIWLPVIMIAGYITGILINYLSDVLPINRRLSLPICQSCGKSLTWLGFLSWARCSNCSNRRFLRHWLVAAGSILVAALIWFFPHDRLNYLLSLLVLAYLGLVFVIDVEHRLILHPTSLAGIGICGISGLFLHGVVNTVLGGLVGFLVMLALYFFGNVFGKWMAKRKGVTYETGDALGYGDVLLAFVLGLLLGWPGISAGLLLAILLAGAFSIVYIIIMFLRKSYHSMTAIPYAPFLIISAIFLIFIL